MGNRNELVEPLISAAPSATTNARSPPEDDRPKADLREVTMLIFWARELMATIKNLADIETTIKIRTGDREHWKDAEIH